MTSREIETRVQEIQDMLSKLTTDLVFAGEKANITIAASSDAITIEPTNGELEVSFWIGY